MYNSLSQSQSQGQFNASGFHSESHSQSFSSQSHSQSNQSQSQSFSRTVSQSSTFSSGGGGGGAGSISGGWTSPTPSPRPSSTAPSSPMALPYIPMPVKNLPPVKKRNVYLSDGVPLVVPEEHTNRTLVLCFDGTGDQFDEDNSNIVKFFSLLKKDDSTRQLVYYQAGIGTYTSRQMFTNIGTYISKSIDSMFAVDLKAHVMAGYEFLMQNYTEGDRICLFGFSRGAYTARCLAGMIHKVGVIPKCNHQQVPFAFEMYKSGSWEMANKFRQTFSIEVDIEFVGVWDTVDSVGMTGHTLPFVSSNKIVKTFRHAVSLDEHRVKFPSHLFEIEPPKGSADATLQHSIEHDRDIETDSKEVWFAGVHCDVGGGSVINSTNHSLARIALRWMIRECFRTNSGIMFVSAGLKSIGLDPFILYSNPHLRRPAPPSLIGDYFIEEQNVNTQDPVPDSFIRMSEEKLERLDALSPMYDQLPKKLLWIISEYLPLRQVYQQWGTHVRFITRALHRGRGRVIPTAWATPRKHQTWFEWFYSCIPWSKRHIKLPAHTLPKTVEQKDKVLVHRSVKMRMQARGKGSNGEVRYIPKAILGSELVSWDDCDDYVEWVD